MTDTRMITNLEGIEAYLREKLDAVSYIAVAERTGNREVQLVRLELPELSEWATPTNWSPMVEAQMGRIRGELLGLADGPRSGFRVCVCGPKGERLTTRTCAVLDDLAPGDLIVPSVDEVIAEVGAKGVVQLGAAWQQFTGTVMAQTAQFGSLCLRQMEKVDEISRQQASLTAAETAAAREQVNALVERLTAAKVSEAEARAELLTASADEAAEAKRTETGQLLARDAISTLGELGQAFLVGKTGLPPEMAEVASALQGNPEMMEALRDPKVRDQLKSPDNLSYLATMLKHAAAVAEEQEAAPTTAGEDSGES
jgi:hypothetical protein